MSGYILTAPESGGYAVPATTGYRDLGVNQDSLKSRQDTLKRSRLTRRNALELLSDRRIIDKGGVGDLPIDVTTNGRGFLLKQAASTYANAVVEGGTLAHQQVFTWTATGPVEGAHLSFTAEKYVERPGGTGGFGGFDVFQYVGGKITGWKLTQSADGFLVWVPSVDFAPGGGRLESDPARVPTEPDGFAFAWPDANVVLTPLEGGSPVDCIKSFELTYDGKLDTEDWCLKRSATKHEPTRTSTPEATGTLESKYRDPQFFDAFKNGAAYSVAADWLAPVAIEGSTYPSLRIDLGAIVFEEPNDPEAKVDGPTEQPLTFRVVDPEAVDEDDAPIAPIIWTQVTSDTAY